MSYSIPISLFTGNVSNYPKRKRKLKNQKYFNKLQQLRNAFANRTGTEEAEIVGKPEKISNLVASDVNYSIGSQWKKRIKEIDEQIRNQANNMTADQKKSTYLNVKLMVE